MKCKKCGRELRVGVKICPYCGTVVPAPGRGSGTEFNWTLKDDSSPSRPKAKKVSPTFDWNTENHVNADTGRVSFQKESKWKEPEEARQLFTFDKAHETLQTQIDRRVEDIAAEKPAPAVQKERREDLFVLPSNMTMEDFSDLLGESIVKESDSVLVVNNREPRTPKNPQAPKPSPTFYEADPQGSGGIKTVSRTAPEPLPPLETEPVWPSEPPASVSAPADAPVQTSVPFPPSSEFVQRTGTAGAEERTPVFPADTVPVQAPKPEKKKKTRSAEDQAYDPFRGRNLYQMEEVPGFLSGKPSAADPLLSFVSEPQEEKSSAAPDTGQASVFDMGALQDLIGTVPTDQITEEKGPSLPVIDPGYTPEEEEQAIENFQHLLNAEEEFSESINQFTYLSGDEEKEAEAAWRRREELEVNSEISFVSLEDEYQKYREDHHLIPESPEEKTAEEPDSEAEVKILAVETPHPDTDSGAESAEEDAVAESSGTSPESAGDKVRKAVSIVRKTAEKAAIAAEESVRSLVEDEEDDEKSGETDSLSSRKEKKKPRELNIKINEPSGTQFKVRTEEVDIADRVNNLTDTQKVDLGILKEGPKSVKVQVEVNHTSSSSSVEVTRTNDGATVVRTVDEGTESEHLYNAEGEDLLYRRPEDESFWDKNDIPASRMTITDIFSTEMKDFREKWEEEEAESVEQGGLRPSSDEEMDLFIADELEKNEELQDSGQQLSTGSGEDEMSDSEQAEETESGLSELAEESEASEDIAAADLTEPEANETDKESEETPEILSGEEESQSRRETNAAERMDSTGAALVLEQEDTDGPEAGQSREGSEESEVSEDIDDADLTQPDTADSEAPADEFEGPGDSDIPADMGILPDSKDSPDSGHEPAGQSPESQDEIQYEDLTTVIPSDQVREKIEEEAAKQEEERPVQISEAGHVKRSGKVRFRYTKIEKDTDNLPESDVLPAEEDQEENKELPEDLQIEDTAEDMETEKTGDEAETGEMQGLFDSLNHIRNRIAKAIGASEEDDVEETTAEADVTAEKKAEEAADDSSDEVKEDDAAVEKESRWSAASIMRIVIIVLIVAIVIEFAVIGIKLFAPNSQGAVLINRIEQSIAGEDIGSTISADSYLIDEEEAEAAELEQ